MGEYIGIGKAEAFLLCVHHYVCDHEGTSAKVEERIRCTHFLYAKDIGKNGAEGLLRLCSGGNVVVHGAGGCRRQGPSVNLLVYVERNLVKLHP